MLNYLTFHNVWVLIQQVIDICVVWALVYYLLKIVNNNSRTIQIFKGILVILLVRGGASLFGLNTVASITDIIMNWGVVALIVIFQPEIRSMLEKLGKTSVFNSSNSLSLNEKETLVDELVKAVDEMAKNKTGALISIEKGHTLNDFINTGTPMNSVVSSELLISIFQYGTPLHDGAVIIQGVKIACAAAYFPPTTKELPTSYGARHRAAVGISEITDSITIIVSEESGRISVAKDGVLTLYAAPELRAYLAQELGLNEKEVVSEDKASLFKRNKKRQEKKNKRKKGTPKEIELKEELPKEVLPNEVNETKPMTEYSEPLEPLNFILHYEQDDEKGSDENE